MATTTMDAARTIEAALENDKVFAQLNKAALEGYDVPRLIANVRAEVAGNESLAKCSASTILKAVMAAARAGLQIGVNGDAYLVPYKGTCTLIPGYRGLIRIAYDGGAVSLIEAHIVYATDAFRYWIDDKGAHVHHEPDVFATNRGEARGAYAYAVLSSGATAIEVMSIDDVLAIRDRSAGVKSGNGSPWGTDPAEMTRKTLIRRLFKRLPLSDRSRERLAATEEQAMTIEGIEPERKRTLKDAIAIGRETAASSFVTESISEPAQLPEGGPAMTFLLSLVDVDLEQRAALLAIEDADLSRHLDTLAMLPESQRAAYIAKAILGRANG